MHWMTWRASWAQAWRRACALYEAPNSSSASETATSEVWCSWLCAQRLTPSTFGALGYVIGSVGSGRHALARSLTRQSLGAGEVCVWLGPSRPWGMWPRPKRAAASRPGVLVWGCAPCDAAAFGMLDIVLGSRMATTVVVVLQGAPNFAGLEEARCVALTGIEAAARRQGACVLILGPPAPADARRVWPRWQLVPAFGRRP